MLSGRSYAVSSHLDLAKRNRFVPVHLDDSLFKVAEILAAGGAHRVPVTDPNDPSKIIDVVSQSTLINFFYKNVRSTALS